MRQKLAKSPLRPVEYELFGQKCVNFIVRDMTQKQMDMTHEYDMKNITEIRSIENTRKTD